MPVDLPDVVLVDDIVTKYGVHAETVTGWIHRGELVAFKLGRAWVIDPDDWQAFLDRRRQAAVELSDAGDGDAPSSPARGPRRQS